MKTNEPGIDKIDGVNGKIYRVQVRKKGHRHQSLCFPTFKAAQKWKYDTIQRAVIGWGRRYSDNANWVQSQLSGAMEDVFTEMFPEYLDTTPGGCVEKIVFQGQAPRPQRRGRR